MLGLAALAALPLGDDGQSLPPVTTVLSVTASVSGAPSAFAATQGRTAADSTALGDKTATAFTRGS